MKKHLLLCIFCSITIVFANAHPYMIIMEEHIYPYNLSGIKQLYLDISKDENNAGIVEKMKPIYEKMIRKEKRANRVLIPTTALGVLLLSGGIFLTIDGMTTDENSEAVSLIIGGQIATLGSLSVGLGLGPLLRAATKPNEADFSNFINKFNLYSDNFKIILK